MQRPLVSARGRLGLIAGLGLAPWALSRSAGAAEINIRIAHTLTAADAAHASMTALAEEMKKRSNGRIEATVFPSDQLGAQADVGEMVRQGAAIIQLTDALFLGKYVPDAAVLQAPYLLDSPDQFRKLIGTPWLKDLEDRLAAKGFRVISWNSYFGTRQILAKKPIRAPADLAGLNFRCAAAPMYVELVKAMGARPVTTGFTEVYTGLAQGTLDLLEAPLPTMWASKFYEQAKFLSLTAHMMAWDPVVMSESVFRAYPADIQATIRELAAAAAEVMTKLKRQEEEDVLPKYKAQGVTVVDNVDREAFKKATAPIYDHFPGFTPGIKAKIDALLAK